jgi:hypothetical protein
MDPVNLSALLIVYEEIHMMPPVVKVIRVAG